MVNYGFDKFDAKKGKAVDVVNPKPREKRRFCIDRFTEFCRRTDLHGYKYIVMDNLNIFERIFWATAVVLSIGFAINFVIIAYEWYARNPIVTVIETTQGAIWDIPFPAVTVCNLNLVSKRAAYALAHNLTLPENITANEVFSTLRLVPLYSSTSPADAEERHALRRLQTVLDLNHVTMQQLISRVSPGNPCGRLVERCMWKNTVFRCEKIFEPVYTHFSLCCSFNYFALDSNFKRKDGSSAFERTLEFPRRVASCGHQTALSILVNTNTDDYYSAMIASEGVLVFIDSAYNIPNTDSPARIVNPTTEVLIALSPEQTYATAGVRSFRPIERQCYYKDEVKIGNFQHYSFHNCIAFKRIEIIKSVCECIPYYFPLTDYHRTCNFNDMDCLASVMGKSSEDGQGAFDCLPECEHYDYPLEVAFGKLAIDIKIHGLPLYEGLHLGNRTVVNVFFNDLVSTRYRRDVYLNWQNLLASFGGLLSLMLGFTLLAGFDLLLFFTFGAAYESLATPPTAAADHAPPKNTRVRNPILVQERSNHAAKADKAVHPSWPTEMRGPSRF